MLFKMWKIVLISVVCLYGSNAQNEGCSLDGVTENDWLTSYRNDPVDDFEDTEFKRFPEKNIQTVNVQGPDYGKYFDAKVEGGFLIIYPTEAFKEYEIEQESVENPAMNIQLVFTCTNSNPRTLTFFQPVTDHNTYPPKFEQPSYTYQLPMPLVAGFNIDVFGDTIIACDDDISNTRLIFSITPDDDFTVSWGEIVSGRKNKCHTAVIKTNNFLRLTQDKSYVITATDIGTPVPKTATTELKIEIDEEASLPPNPQFESAYYTADYNSEDDSHSITVNGPINLKEGCSKLALSLVGGVHEYEKDNFSVECDQENVVVKLISNLLPDTLENSPIVLITVEANLEQAEEVGRTVLVVYLPKQECSQTSTIIFTPTIPSTAPTLCPSTVAPTECPLCPTESTTSYSCPPCTTECPSTATDCTPCSTTPTECPSISTECPLSCPPCSTTPGDCISVSTECPLSCPTTELSTDCPVCLTTPGKCPLTPPDCSLTCPPRSSAPGVFPSVSTECPISCPTPELTTECPICPTTPGDSSSVSTECPISCPTPELTTECPICPTTPGDSSSVSTECPISCPTPANTTECPPWSTTPAPPLPETVIKFEKDNYWYKVKSTFVGYPVGTVKAVVTPEEDIAYSIEGEEDFMECDVKTGELKITREVEPNTYTFTAYAIGVDTETKTQTTVQVEIFENSDPDTENSILVKHVTEEKEAEIELPCRYTYCTYEIIYQYPEPEEKIFDIQDHILHVMEIKRERQDIINMLVPQFSLQLILTDVGPIQETNIQSINDSNMSLNTNIRATEVPSEWAFIPANVPNIPNQLLMSIIIDDINNNYPVFEVGTDLVIGYPTADLAIQLSPPYIVKVVATDLDAGENAVIRYSTDSPYFVVHPETGVVYPGEDAFDDETNLKFVVTAKDRNGAEDGLTADLNIEVKLLTQENLITLVVKNLMLEDIDITMEKLSEESDLKINYLIAAVVALDNTEDSVFRSDYTLRLLSGFKNLKALPDHYSRIIVYGLSSTNEPVKNDELQKVLEDTDVLENFTVDKWEEPEISSEENNTTGYIAAIAVLASLLVIFMIGAAAFYYFKIYRTKKAEPYNTMEEEETNSVNFEKNPRASSVGKFEDAPQRRVTGFIFNPPPVEEDEDEYGERTYQDTTDYGVKEEWAKDNGDEFAANKVTYVDPVDVEENIYSENKYEDPDYDGERRKSVKFKETVEKINIIVDDRQDEDVLDERL